MLWQSTQLPVAELQLRADSPSKNFDSHTSLGLRCRRTCNTSQPTCARAAGASSGGLVDANGGTKPVENGTQDPGNTDRTSLARAGKSRIRPLTFPGFLEVRREICGGLGHARVFRTACSRLCESLFCAILRVVHQPVQGIQQHRLPYSSGGLAVRLLFFYFSIFADKICFPTLFMFHDRQELQECLSPPPARF